MSSTRKRLERWVIRWIAVSVPAAPAPMTTAFVEELVEGFGDAARRMAEAGADGVEIVGSHGYLPSQFWSSKVNRREDRYGGSFDKRLTFTREVIAAIRARVPKDMIVGLRVAPETEREGLDLAEHGERAYVY